MTVLSGLFALYVHGRRELLIWEHDTAFTRLSGGLLFLTSRALANGGEVLRVTYCDGTTGTIAVEENELAALERAVTLWLLHPPRVEIPAFREPRERFLATLPHGIAVSHDWALPTDSMFAEYGALVPDDYWKIAGYLSIAQKEFSVEVLPFYAPKPNAKSDKMSTPYLSTVFPPWRLVSEIKAEPVGVGTPWRVGDVFALVGANRVLGFRYTAETIAPLLWAEVLHCVKENIPAAKCAVCGRVFVAKSPKQDYRQKYCSPACRRAGDKTQDNEAQALYKQFMRGKLTAEEYLALAGDKAIGAKRGKLAKNSS